jgi:S-adenosylmethionine decarboxylase
MRLFGASMGFHRDLLTCNRNDRKGPTLEFITSKFEGSEKKLEITLDTHRESLRSNVDGRWNRVVKASKARIISKASTGCLDAYLLSESSLFVWPDRVVMITCGTTTLTKAFPDIIRILGKSHVALVFYQRQKCVDPQRQWTDFREDIACLEGYFPGRYFKIGAHTHHPIDIFYSTHSGRGTLRNATLQLAMRNLDPTAMKIFCTTNDGSAEHAKAFLGLERIYPDTTTDSYLFSPSGYSMNGISGADYFTVHVTPQSDASYASFETSFMKTDYCTVTEKLISVFKPEHFSLSLITGISKPCGALHASIDSVPGYVSAHKSFDVLDCGYTATYRLYQKK